MHHTSPNIATCVLITSLLTASIVLMISCTPGNNDTQSTSMRDAGSSVDEQTLDLGEDWDSHSASTTPQRAQRQQQSRPRQEQQTGRWSIVLGTFSGDDHVQQASGAHQHVTSNLRELSAARVHSTERGSMLLYGQYESADDPRGRADLERIKELTINDMPLFTRAFLSPTPQQRTNASSSSAPAGAHDLMSVRERHPNVHPIYTVQVGVWGDFGSGAMTAQEIRRNAEAHAQRLRAEGHEAYVYHDDRQNQSLVTVGLFDRTAMNQKTGEFGPELRALIRKFPAHLVNGEELHEPIDRRRPDRGTRVQEPRVVIVPRTN